MQYQSYTPNRRATLNLHPYIIIEQPQLRSAQIVRQESYPGLFNHQSIHTLQRLNSSKQSSQFILDCNVQIHKRSINYLVQFVGPPKQLLGLINHFFVFKNKIICLLSLLATGNLCNHNAYTRDTRSFIDKSKQIISEDQQSKAKQHANIETSEFLIESPQKENSIQPSNLSSFISIFQDSGLTHLEYSNGSYYYGEVKDSLRHGLGVLYDKNNKCCYEGEWQNDHYEGKGILHNLKYQICEQVKVNEDNFLEINDSAWLKYQGEFKAGARYGVGKQEYDQIGYYVGRFKNGKFNGIGCFHQKDKSRIQGIWKDNILQQQL